MPMKAMLILDSLELSKTTGSLERITVGKSAYHHQSHTEIASDKPVLAIYPNPTQVSG
jgi:hypothetical protein